MTVKDRDSERVGPMLNPPHLRELLRESMEETGWNVTEMCSGVKRQRIHGASTCRFSAASFEG